MHWIALLPPHEDEALSWGWHGLRFTPRVARLEEAWVLEIEARGESMDAYQIRQTP